MQKTGTLPQHEPASGWAALLPPRPPTPALAGERRFDWLVIGAGYAGLMAARRLAQHRPQETVALLDSGELGQNASGRNAGFAIDLPHLLKEGALTAAQAQQDIRLSRAAIDLLRKLVHAHGIDCQWRECGRYHCAVSPRGRQTMLDPYVRELQRWQEPHRVLQRTELAAQLGTSYYHSAVYTPGAVLLNPAALCRGLGDSLPENVTLFEHSPVVAHDLRGARPVVRTPQGQIRAARVVLTVNVFAEQFGLWRNRQLPILLMASLSAPLPAEARKALGSLPEWGITPANGVTGPTLRLTADGRLLVRHGFEYCPGLRCDPARVQAMRQRHQAVLIQRFPQLAGQALRLEHSWMGWLGVSRNKAPLFDRLAPHLFAVACCNGVGIARHTAAGAAIADWACGVDSALLHAWQAQQQAAWLPPRPWLDVGVRLRLRWEAFAGRHER